MTVRIGGFSAATALKNVGRRFLKALPLVSPETDLTAVTQTAAGGKSGFARLASSRPDISVRESMHDTNNTYAYFPDSNVCRIGG